MNAQGFPAEWCGASCRFPGVNAQSTRRRGGIRWEYRLNCDFCDLGIYRIERGEVRDIIGLRTQVRSLRYKKSRESEFPRSQARWTGVDGRLVWR